jgi:predicted metal-dependent hydrolase
MRMLSAWVAIVCLTGPMIRIARRMMRDDPTPITPEMREQARALQRNINRMQLPMLRAYFRPSFHPWQVRDEVHLQEWYASPEIA